MANIAHQAALRLVHDSDSGFVVHEVCGAILVDAEVPCGFDGVDVCTEEDEFPAVLLLLAFNHLLHAFGGVLAARILVAVGGDDEDGLFGAVFVAGVLVHVADVVNCPADGVEERGAATGVVFLFGERCNVCKRGAVVEHFHFGVEEDGGNERFARLLFLLVDGAVEAPDSILFEPAHGTAAVQDKYDFGESLFHDCLRAAIRAA